MRHRLKPAQNELKYCLWRDRIIRVLGHRPLCNLTGINRALGKPFRNPSSLRRYLDRMYIDGYVAEAYMPRCGHLYALAQRGWRAFLMQSPLL